MQASASKDEAQPVEVRSSDLAHPFLVRPGTTDVHALVEAVARKSYETYLPSPPVRRILDAGANVGDTSARYLTRFPEATVVALEPDPDNYRMARRNLAPYGTRAVVWNVGLWDRESLLRVAEGATDLAVTVAEVPDGEPYDCRGISVRSVLSAMSWDQLDIFKCDIEGAEYQVFAANDVDAWLSHTRSVVIETHGETAAGTVHQTLSGHPFIHWQHRELDFYIRSSKS